MPRASGDRTSNHPEESRGSTVRGLTRAATRRVLPELRPYLVGLSLLPIVATLYWGQAVLIPIALAGLLTFLLSPAVSQLERAGLAHVPFGRVVAVILVVVLVFSALGVIAWVVSQQVIALAHELPKYQGNLKQRISTLSRASTEGALKEVRATAQEVMGEFTQGPPAKGESRPVPVVVKSEPLGLWIGLWQFPRLLEALGSASFVIVLVIFMLIERQDLRNRLLRLIGHRRLANVTKAMDETGGRITRYLIVHTLINLTYGTALGLGLFLIGVPYAVLWGLLAFLLRFVPYVGALMAAVVPIALSLAVFSGWAWPLLVVGLFVVVELVTNLVVEPLLLRQTAGVSQVALFVSIAFWTWLWGPIGLVLATPLTVCVVVLGKHVPALSFITVLMADEPALPRDIRYYQRLLANDPVEGSDIVEAYLEDHEQEEVYDAILVPALIFTKRDRERERVTSEEVQTIHGAMRELIEGLAAHGSGSEGPLVLACAARDEADGLALMMFGQLVSSAGCAIEQSSAHALSSEVEALVATKDPAILLVATLPPDGLAQTRFLCKRVRARFPAVNILVGRWGEKELSESDRGQLLTAGADAVGTSLLESRGQLLERLSLAASNSSVSS